MTQQNPLHSYYPCPKLDSHLLSMPVKNKEFNYMKCNFKLIPILMNNLLCNKAVFLRLAQYLYFLI